MSPVYDVDEADFEQKVVERSREVPVVVDFWAEWCGPCKALTPALEKAAAEREGKVELAKVDVDSNQALAQRFGVQGIPSVKAFRDGEVAEEFTGALPPDQIERFFDMIAPSEADELVAVGDEDSVRRALELDPRHEGARRRLARLHLQRGEREEALALLEDLVGDFVAGGLRARAQLEAEGDSPTEAFEAWDQGDAARALELLQDALAAADGYDRRDLVRQVMVAIFEELGPAHPLAGEHRRRLAAVLN